MNTDKYIGIPFKANGRSTEGLDCWGLVRLIYKDEYNIDLPSFDTQYHITDDERIVDLIAQYREGWEQTDEPVIGSTVLFNVLGNVAHIGIVVDYDTFIHVREGSDCVLDKLSSVKWNKRIHGFYNYKQNTGAVLNAVPHPLKTERITVAIPDGTTLSDLVPWIDKEYKIDQNLPKKVVFLVNSVPIPQELWSTTVLKSTDTVEYRAVLGRDVLRIALIFAVVWFAPYIANFVAAGGAAGSFSVAAGAAATTTTAASALQGFAAFAATTAVRIVGLALIDVIAPIRPPPAPTDPGSPESQLIVTGGNNPYNPYGAIPVVLGKVRLTPPMGSKSFVRFASDGVVTYLNMMLVWGYGPLEIDQASIKVGEVDWDDYLFDTAQGGGRVTLDYKTTPTATDLSNFKLLYGNDVTQLTSGIQMTGPARSAVTSSVSFGEVSSGNLYTRSPGGFGTITIDLATGGAYEPPLIDMPDNIFESTGG